MQRAYLGLGLAALLAAEGAQAGGTDPAAARAQLQQGYALKQKGKCEEAIPYFAESVRLDRQPKALLNLADCEEKLHRLSAAQSHLVETRDLARSLGLAPYEKAAQERLAALEKTIPKLAIKLAGDAPHDTMVTRDGVELSQVSLNTPLPIDPGPHTVVARTSTLERQYDVALAEGETKVLEVTPTGGKSSAAAPPAPLPVPVQAHAPLDAPDSTATADERSTNNPQKTVGFVVTGAGVIGVGLGIFFAAQFASKNEALGAMCSAAQPCAPNDANSAYENARDEAKSARTLSIIGLAGGGVALGAGLFLILTAPSSTSAAGLPSSSATGAGSRSTSNGPAGFRVAPLVGSNVAGLVAGGNW